MATQNEQLWLSWLNELKLERLAIDASHTAGRAITGLISLII
jgi:hypothetical protein